jgi:hypothetical protein
MYSSIHQGYQWHRYDKDQIKAEKKLGTDGKNICCVEQQVLSIFQEIMMEVQGKDLGGREVRVSLGSGWNLVWVDCLKHRCSCGNGWGEEFLPICILLKQVQICIESTFTSSKSLRWIDMCGDAEPPTYQSITFIGIFQKIIISRISIPWALKSSYSRHVSSRASPLGFMMINCLIINRTHTVYTKIIHILFCWCIRWSKSDQTYSFMEFQMIFVYKLTFRCWLNIILPHVLVDQLFEKWKEIFLSFRAKCNATTLCLKLQDDWNDSNGLCEHCT